MAVGAIDAAFHDTGGTFTDGTLANRHNFYHDQVASTSSAEQIRSTTVNLGSHMARYNFIVALEFRY